MKKALMGMQQRKWLLPVLVGIAACMIVWRVGFYTPQAKSPANRLLVPKGVSGLQTVSAAEQKGVPSDSPSQPAAAPASSDKPPAAPDPNQKAAPVTQPGPQTPKDASGSPTPSAAKPEGSPAAAGSPQEQKPAAPATAKLAAEPNALNVASDEGEAINLKDVEMRLIIQKIADWTGKVVIPTDEIMKEKITIYAPSRLPRKEALEQIYGALRIKGYTAEYVDKTIYLKRIRDARIGMVPMISPDQPLAGIENKEQIVQKSFRLTNSSPGQMVPIVQPLIGEYGHISTDEPTSSLLDHRFGAQPHADRDDDRPVRCPGGPAARHRGLRDPQPHARRDRATAADAAGRRGPRPGRGRLSGPCSRCPIPAPGSFGARGRGGFASSSRGQWQPKAR